MTPLIALAALSFGPISDIYVYDQFDTWTIRADQQRRVCTAYDTRSKQSFTVNDNGTVLITYGVGATEGHRTVVSLETETFVQPFEVLGVDSGGVAFFDLSPRFVESMLGGEMFRVQGVEFRTHGMNVAIEGTLDCYGRFTQ